MSTPGQAGTPTMGQVLWDTIEEHARDLWTAFPGSVVSYDASSQTATIRPGIRLPVQLDVDEVEGVQGLMQEADGSYSLTIPDLDEVPVRMPFAGGGWRITSSLQAGDLVLCHVTTRDFLRWLAAAGQVVTVPPALHHDINDCWAEPWGLGTTTTSLVLEGHGARIALRPNGTIDVVGFLVQARTSGAVTSEVLVDGTTLSLHTALRTSLTEITGLLAAWGLVAPYTTGTLIPALLAGTWKSSVLEAEQ